MYSLVAMMDVKSQAAAMMAAYLILFCFINDGLVNALFLPPLSALTKEGRHVTSMAIDQKRNFLYFNQCCHPCRIYRINLNNLGDGLQAVYSDDSDRCDCE